MIRGTFGVTVVLAAFCFQLFFTLSAGAQNTVFQYQGNLSDGGVPANGSYDLEFALYDAVTNGDQVGPVLTNSATVVSNGCFSVALNFGNVFNGGNYWLQIAAQTNGGSGFIALNPRQQITSVPYAITAANALGLVGSLPASQLSGTVPLSQLPASILTNGATGLNLTGTFVGNGAGLSGIFASNLTSDITILQLLITNSPPTPSTNWTFYPMSQNSSNFLTIGGPIATNQDGPGGYFNPLVFQTGASGQMNFENANAMSETFGMDGSQFVFVYLGKFRVYDILVNGVDNLITNQEPNDGSQLWATVTFATAANRTITLRNAYAFSGVYLPVTNDFFIPPTLTNRMVVLGDSYTEQTYTAGSQCAGIVSQMQTLLPQMDIWALGEGGTGFYDGGIAGGTNFLGRLQDIVYANPNYIVIYGGIDDLAYVTNSSLDNPVFVNATNLIQSLQTQLPSAKIVVIGPQSPRGLSPITDSNVFNFGNLLNAACSACGVPYVSPIAPQWITGDVSIPNSGNADVYTIPIEGTHPTIPAGAKFYALKIVSALSSIWNLSNPASGQANSTFELLTNGIPTPVPGIGILWNSNNVLYWVTTANTNYISGP